MKDAFFDNVGLSYSACRPPRPGNHDNLSDTVAMVIVEPALTRVFTRYSLDRDPVLLAAEWATWSGAHRRRD